MYICLCCELNGLKLPTKFVLFFLLRNVETLRPFLTLMFLWYSRLLMKLYSRCFKLNISARLLT